MGRGFHYHITYNYHSLNNSTYHIQIYIQTAAEVSSLGSFMNSPDSNSQSVSPLQSNRGISEVPFLKCA
jgi:hypothetical protein